MLDLHEPTVLHTPGRAGRPPALPVGDGPARGGRPRPRPRRAADDALAARPPRRRVRRLVVLPGAGGRPARGRAGAAAVPEVGRRRAGPARGRRRLPDRRAARRVGLARAVDRQGRHPRLAGLLPLAQPGRRRAAALPHPPRALRMLAESLEHTLVPLVAMRYAVVALRLRALEDVLAGPQDLHASLGHRLARGAGAARVVRRRPARRAARRAAGRCRRCSRHAAAGGRCSAWRRRSCAPAPAPPRPGPPQHAAGPADARLWRLARVDSAWLTTAAGTTAEHRRDARTARRLLRRSLVLHARLVARWPALRRAYRAALPDLVAPGDVGAHSRPPPAAEPASAWRRPGTPAPVCEPEPP